MGGSLPRAGIWGVLLVSFVFPGPQERREACHNDTLPPHLHLASGNPGTCLMFLHFLYPQFLLAVPSQRGALICSQCILVFSPVLLCYCVAAFRCVFSVYLRAIWVGGFKMQGVPLLYVHLLICGLSQLPSSGAFARCLSHTAGRQLPPAPSHQQMPVYAAQTPGSLSVTAHKALAS